MDFTDANTGWVCGSLGTVGSGAVYRTTNGGVNWTIQSSVFTGGKNLWAIDFVNSSTGWVVGDNTTKIFKTTDGGINWTAQTAPSTVTGALYTVCLLYTSPSPRDS